MRFRHLMKIKKIQKEISDLKNISSNDIKQRLAIFYEEYNRQMPIIEHKIATSNHLNKIQRICEFKNDLNEIKSMFDSYLYDIEKTIQSANLKEKIAKKTSRYRIDKFILILRRSKAIQSKYKKENCNIDNFEC